MAKVAIGGGPHGSEHARTLPHLTHPIINHLERMLPTSHRHHHCQYHALVYPDCHMGANQDPWETTKTHGSQSMPLGSYQPRLLGANQPRPLRANHHPWETIKTHGSQSRTLGANQPILLGNNQLCWTKTHGSQPRSLRANQHPWEPIKFDWWSQRKGLAWLRKWHDKKVSEIIVM